MCSHCGSPRCSAYTCPAGREIDSHRLCADCFRRPRSRFAPFPTDPLAGSTPGPVSGGEPFLGLASVAGGSRADPASSGTAGRPALTEARHSRRASPDRKGGTGRRRPTDRAGCPRPHTRSISGSLGIDVVRIGSPPCQQVTSEARWRVRRTRRAGASDSRVALARVECNRAGPKLPAGDIPGSSAVPSRQGRRCTARCARPRSGRP